MRRVMQLGGVLAIAAVALGAAAAVTIAAIDPAPRWGAGEQVSGLPRRWSPGGLGLSADGTRLAVGAGFTNTTTIGARRNPDGSWTVLTLPDTPNPLFRVEVDDAADFIAAAGGAGGGPVYVIPAGTTVPQGAPLTVPAGAVPAIGAAGDAAVAWAGADGALHATYRPAATAVWDAETVVSPPVVATAAFSTVRLAVGPAGHAVAVWTVRTATGRSLLASRRTGPAAWGPAQIIDTIAGDGDFGLSGGSPAVDQSGGALVAWTRKIGVADPTVQSAVMSPAGVWTGEGTIGTAGPSASGVTLGMNAAGGAVAGWTGASTSRGTGVVVARRPAGGGWGLPETLADDGAFTGPAIDISADGTVIASWTRMTAAGLDPAPVAAIAAAGNPFGPKEDLDFPLAAAGGSRYVSGVGIDDAGHAVAVWSDSVAVSNRTWVARFDTAGIPRSRPATRIRTARVRGPALAGALTRFDLGLTQAVENERVTLQRLVAGRWRPLVTVRVSGIRPRPAIRLSSVGVSRFRLVLHEGNGVSVSPVVRLGVVRSPSPVIPVCPGASDLAAGGGTIWMFCGPNLTGVDPATRRVRSVPRGAATAFAVGRGVIWLMEPRRLVPIDAGNLGIGPPVDLTPAPGAAAAQIATDGADPWVLLQVPFTGLVKEPEELVRVDAATGAVAMRVPLVAPAVDEFSQTPIAGRRGVWVPRRFTEGPDDRVAYLLRVDRTTGRVVRVAGGYGLVAGGPAGVWATGRRLVRIDPPRGPAGPDTSRLGLAQLAVGNGRLWGLSVRDVRLKDGTVLFQALVAGADPATGRAGRLAPVGPRVESGVAELVPAGRRAWVLLADLGVLTPAPS